MELLQAMQSRENASVHVLAGTYYNLKGGLRATLMMSNQGPTQMEVKPTLFGAGGRRFDLPIVTIAPASVVAVNLGDHVRSDSDFGEGNIQVNYKGKRLELGGVVQMLDSRQSLVFDEELQEPAKNNSTRLEGMWQIPLFECEAKVVLTNAADVPLSVKTHFQSALPGHGVSSVLTLSPHETKLIDLNKVFGHRLVRPFNIGGISLAHSGPKGALLAHGMVQSVMRGFSTVIEFTDPKTVKSTRLDGTGLRFGKVGSEDLIPTAAFRNLSSSATVVRGRLLYADPSGYPGVIPLPDITLAPGELRDLNLLPFTLPLAAREISAPASVEFEYSGEPGDVLVRIQSYSTSGNHVFRVPLVNALAIPSSTGRYPWRIDESSSTFVYIKNVTDRPQDYVLELTFLGGDYTMGIKTLPPGQTAYIDVRKLRDDQVPDAVGNVMPTGASGGQLHWYVRGKENNVLVGRAEQVDFANGLCTTSACPECCPPTFRFASMDPQPIVGNVGDTTDCEAMQQDVNCYGQLGCFYPVGALFTSQNPPVATIDYISGFATAVGEGTAYFQADWQPTQWFLGGTPDFIGDPDRCYAWSAEMVNGTTMCDVVPPVCAIPRNFRQDGEAQTQGRDMIINYKWDSSTGNLADLSPVTIGERVDYPERNCNSNRSYCPPSPPWALDAAWLNPTLIPPPDIPPTGGAFHDTHESRNFRTPYTGAMFRAKQIYRYRTACAANNAWVELAQYNIDREVLNQSGWKYKITKGSNVKTFPLN